MAKLSFDQVRKVYDNGYVGVEGATFDVEDGELMVLVGPSGCGKSTLLRMIAGLEEISSGTLKIGERVVNNVSPKDRDIAMVFQSYALYPHMTVRENLGFALKLRNEPKALIEERIQEAAQMLELERFLDNKPAALSGGQRQRVALGRSLVRHPQILLLDEPLSNLDAKLRASMRIEIAKLHRKLGATMVYVTHDQVEAMTLGQRIVVLKDGKIQQIDTPDVLYRHPANLFVATFLGSPSMNTLRGKLDGHAFTLDNGAQMILPNGAGLTANTERPLILGVRPEHLLIEPADGSAAISATVEVVESIGNEMFVNMDFDGIPLVARCVPRDLPKPGEAIRLGIDAAALRFFDAETEQAV